MQGYNITSPWFFTNLVNNNYLDIMEKRSIPIEADDVLFVITPQYTYRPDLLAFDLYASSKLWWVFAARNPNIIKDPVFDFRPGVQIYLPKKSTLISSIGI
jgi:hypothetical protein